MTNFTEFTKILAHPEPEERADLIFNFLIGNQPLASHPLLAETLEKMVNHADKTEQAWGHYLQMGLAYFGRHLDLALKNAEQALLLFEELQLARGLASTYTNLGMAFWAMGDRQRALENAFKGLRYFEELPQRHVYEGQASYLLGSYYLDLKDLVNAERYFRRAHEVIEELETDIGSLLSRAKIGMASVATQLGDYIEALGILSEVIEDEGEEGNIGNLGRVYNDIAFICRKLDKIEEAELYYEKALELRRKLSVKQGLITSLLDYSEFLFLNNLRTEKIEGYLVEALMLAEEASARPKQARTYKLLSEFYKEKGDYAQALMALESYDKIFQKNRQEEAELRIKNLESQLDLERKERENEIERFKNVELKAAFDAIAEKNRDITASINYAKRIQDAILPNLRLLQTCFPEAFVLFRPRDIVSGDFYYIERTPSKKFVVAAVDCTGHGVPGAFMSLIGYVLLHEIVQVKGSDIPHKILTELHLNLKALLQQEDSKNRDGMDMALIVADSARRELQFAGAKNPLVLVDKESGEIQQIKGDIFSIGGEAGRSKKEISFTTHSVQPPESSFLYLYSDGYQDQFGGPRGKKFMKKRFRQLLGSMHRVPLATQENFLAENLENWRGEYRQVDDVLVIGLSWEA